MDAIGQVRKTVKGEKVMLNGSVGPAKQKFVLFGSSIVQYSFVHKGWGAQLADIYKRQADIFLRGYSGWNSRRAVNVLDDIFREDVVAHPSLVIVYFGGNDSASPHSTGLGPHVPILEYVENMRRIATHLQGLSNTARLIFLSCPPVSEPQVKTFEEEKHIVADEGRSNNIRRDYSEVLIRMCNDMEIEVIDLFNAIQQVDNWQEACFLDDGIHFSAKGSEVVLEEILKVLNKAD